MASNAPQGFTPQHAKVLKADVIPKATIVGESKKLFTNPFDDTPFIHQPVSNYRTDATINYERLKDRNKRIRSLMDLDPRTTEAMLLNIAGAWEAGQIQKQFNDIRGTAIKQAEAEAEKEKRKAVKENFEELIDDRYPDKDDKSELAKHPALFNELIKTGDWDAYQKEADKRLDKPRRNKKNRAWMDKTYDKEFLQWFEQEGGNLNDLAKFKIKDGQDTEGNVVNGIRSIINKAKEEYDNIPRILGQKERAQLVGVVADSQTKLQNAIFSKALDPDVPEHAAMIEVLRKVLTDTYATILSGQEAVIPRQLKDDLKSKVDDVVDNAVKNKETATTESRTTALNPTGRMEQLSEVDIKEGKTQRNFFNQPEGATQTPTKKKLPPKVRQEIDMAEKANPLRKDTGGAIDKVDAFASGPQYYEAPLSSEERKKREAIVTSDITEKKHQDRLKKEGVFDEVYGDEEVDSDDWADDLFGIDGAIKLGKKLSPITKKKLQKAGDKLLSLAEKFSPEIDEPEEEKLELGEWTGKHTKEGRKIYHTNKGWEASEYTIGVKHQQINGGELTHIPSIYGGKIVDQATAEQNIIDNGGKDPETGRYIGPGGDPEARSRSIGEQKKLYTRFASTAKDRMMDLVMPKGERSIHLEESVGGAEYGSDGSVGRAIVKAAEEGDQDALVFMEKLDKSTSVEQDISDLKTRLPAQKDSIGYFEGIGKVYNSIRNKYNKWRKGYQGEDKITTAAQAEAEQKKIRGLTDEQRKNIDRTKRQQSIASGEPDIDTDRTTPRNAFGYGKAPASPRQIESSFESAYKQSKTQFKKDAVWANIKTENPPLDPNAIGFRLEEDPKTGKMKKKTTKEFPNGIPVSYGLAQVRMGAVKDVVKANPKSTIAVVFKGKNPREIKELLFDPTVNMTVSAMYHELLRKRFRNNKHTKGFSNKDFEDLVIAAYNAGPTAMSKIIDKAMVKRSSISMKSLYAYLPRETQLHVDKFRINRTK